MPLYSPFFNQIKFFCNWKTLVLNVNALNEKDLFNSIHQSISETLSENCNGNFRKKLRFIQQCLNDVKNIYLNNSLGFD